MTDNQYLLAVIAVMTVATFITRVLPFVAFRNRADHPLLVYLGRYIPGAVMMVLVVYSLKSTDVSTPPYGGFELAAIGITLAVHLWKGNSLLSIFAGTAFYMAMVQGVFA